MTWRVLHSWPCYQAMALCNLVGVKAIEVLDEMKAKKMMMSTLKEGRCNLTQV